VDKKFMARKFLENCWSLPYFVNVMMFPFLQGFGKWTLEGSDKIRVPNIKVSFLEGA
jgi:hypothetical protein